MSSLVAYSTETEFKLGDIVRRQNGISPLMVVCVCRSEKRYIVTYLSSIRCIPDLEKFSSIEELCSSIISYYPKSSRQDICKIIPFEDKDHEQYVKLWFRLKLPTLGEEKMSKLYEFKDGTGRFGTLLTKNSKGQMVLELKGTGEVIAVDDNQVEIVTPYTVKIKDVGSGTNPTHVSVEKDILKQGDILLDLITGNMISVLELDTKVADCKPLDKKYVKILTEKLYDK